MRAVKRFFSRLWNFSTGRRGDQRLREEMEEHVALQTEENIRAGMAFPEARRQARLKFGPVEPIRNEYRAEESLPFIDAMARDLRFAFRQLRRNPGFALTAILVLALGMGVSMAIFAFVDAALLEPLPYANPNRLMSVNEASARSPRWPLSYPDFLDWRGLNKSFSSLDVYSGAAYLLGAPSGAQSIQAERVSGDFFRTLGVRPIRGRDFYPGEDRLGGPNVLMLSYRTWLNRFGGQHNAVGRTVDLDGAAYTIIGVLPRTFVFAPAANAEFWVPINALSPHEHSRNFYQFWGIGRLRDGVSPSSALVEMNAISKQLQREYGLTGSHLYASVIPLSEVVVGDARPVLLTLLGGAALLLLIACVNVGSLVLVRSESRRREIAVRGALGASPSRLVQQFVAEGFLLAAFGLSAGLAVAVVVMKLLSGLVPANMAANMPFLERVNLSLHTCIFAALIGLFALFLTVAMPIFRLSCRKAPEGLAEGSRGSANRSWQRLGSNLAVVELAIAVVLLVGAGLLGRSLYRLLHVPLGFDPNHLATLEVSPPGAIYKNDAQVAALYAQILRHIKVLPGVQSAGMTSLLPVQCNCAVDAIQVMGKTGQIDQSGVDERHINPGYLSTLGAILIRGRLISEADNSSKPRVALINKRLAEKYFPNEDPIGQRISDSEGGQPTAWEIVGEVEDVHEGPLDVATWPTEYFPLGQTHNPGFSLVIRTQRDPAGVLPLVVQTLHQINPNIAVANEGTMNQQIDATQAALLHRFSAWLVGGFAAAAFVLGLVGLYGVIAYSVKQRTREIGVRIALGAQRRAIYALVLRQAGWLTALGLAIGLICALGASRFMRSMLFGVETSDALTLGCVTALLAAASMAAAFVPARRAASADPVEALRVE